VTGRVESDGRVVRAVIWLPGLAVAVGAAVATAHGLFEVAVAARVPAAIAWLYPLITDGLALVAYAATARLAGGPARYAWSVVVLAAGLSGLAQASYLAGGASLNASPALRFGVGAWPAVAAAVVAHLLYLLAAHPVRDTNSTATDSAINYNAGTIANTRTSQSSTGVAVPAPSPAVAPDRSTASRALGASTHRDPDPDPAPAEPVTNPAPSAVQPGVQSHPYSPSAVQPVLYNALSAELSDPGPTAQEPASGAALNTPVEHPRGPVEHSRGPVERPSDSAAETAPRDRARTAAARHADRHGALPTVSELEALAAVSRGTAAAALKALRERPTPLHVVPRVPDTPDQETQP
jgi:hypothetical protein